VKLMGCVCSSTEMVVTGSHKMPGVPSEILEETYRDVEKFPSFIPQLLEVEFLRGKPSTVGACWNERRTFDKKEIVIRKTITNMSDHPFTARAIIEFSDERIWTLPSNVHTLTYVIEPDSEDSTSSCVASWIIAFVSVGVYGKILAALCLPCLKKALNEHLEEEMQYFYEEALRRTIAHMKRIEDNEAEPS